jgi:predicted amidophosphoribosyltransferase
MMMVFWWVSKNWVNDARFDQTHDSRPVYLRIDASCQFCGNPLPENAAFCSFCGNSVERDIEDDESV